MGLGTWGIRTLVVAVTAGSALLAQPATGTTDTTLDTLPSVSAAGTAAALPRLRGTVGPDSTITISQHRVVKGRYRLVVKDESTIHNWHITGPGIDRSTTAAGTGRSVWRVRLRRGNYTIVCDTHSLTMTTSLRVTAG